MTVHMSIFALIPRSDTDWKKDSTPSMEKLQWSFATRGVGCVVLLPTLEYRVKVLQVGKQKVNRWFYN